LSSIYLLIVTHDQTCFSTDTIPDSMVCSLVVKHSFVVCVALPNQTFRLIDYLSNIHWMFAVNPLHLL